MSGSGYYESGTKYHYGMDADLARKKDAKYSVEREHQASSWIQAVTGEEMSGSFHLRLKNGVILCKLVNTIWPGSIRKINMNNMPFMQRENITGYLEVCRNHGMTETDLFVSQDLFEGDNLGAVVDNIHCLGGIARREGWNGAQLGVKIADKNQRNFSAEQRSQYVPSRQTQGSAGYEVERNPVLAGQIKKDVSGHKASQSVMSRQTQGSAGYEVERNPVLAHQIKKDVSGHKASQSVQSRQTQGSYGFQDSSPKVELRHSDIIRDVDAIHRDQGTR